MSTEQQAETDFAPIEQRRVREESHDAKSYNTETASRQWHVERITNASCFSGIALYLTLHDRWFIHRYHQWDRYNSITPVSRHKAILFIEKNAPAEVFRIFGPLPEAGAGPKRKKKTTTARAAVDLLEKYRRPR